MILNLHGSLGDQVMLTGIPEAYYKLTGEKTYIKGGRHELWDSNPYITGSPEGREFSYAFNEYPKDYMIYYPVRIFYDLTGKIVDRNFVHPNLYRSWERSISAVVINDQAGWPSRTGYRFFEDLVLQFKMFGYSITYVRNDSFANCHGQTMPRQIQSYDQLLLDIPLSNLIEVIGRAGLYVGYNSGLSQLAGALNTPYVMLDGSVPPINTAHNSCIYTPEIKDCRRCVSESCEAMCLASLENINEQIANPEIAQKAFKIIRDGK